MQLVQFFNPKLEIEKLKYETVAMIRQSREVFTMKSLIICYDILDLTEQINRPWDRVIHQLKADQAAFGELRTRADNLILYRDPSEDRVLAYQHAVARLINHWNLTKKNEHPDS